MASKDRIAHSNVSTISLPRAILFASGLSLALACAGPPPPVQAPANERAALIAIKVALDKEGETERLYFVRLEDGEPVIQDEVISSNYFEDGYVYLLNAKPGRYVAVAAAKLTQEGHAPGPMTPVGGGFSVGASYNPGPRESVTFFPAEVIEATLVEVKPGRVAFMGVWVLNTPWSPGIGDEIIRDQLLRADHRVGAEPSEQTDNLDQEVYFLYHAFRVRFRQERHEQAKARHRFHEGPSIMG